MLKNSSMTFQICHDNNPTLRKRKTLTVKTKPFFCNKYNPHGTEYQEHYSKACSYSWQLSNNAK